jgi:hypothetical protein
MYLFLERYIQFPFFLSNTNEALANGNVVQPRLPCKESLRIRGSVLLLNVKLNHAYYFTSSGEKLFFSYYNQHEMSPHFQAMLYLNRF